MNTTTIDRMPASEQSFEARKPQTGLFMRLINAFIASREAEARRRIAIHLDGFSDAHLTSLGIDAPEIKKLRGK